MSQDQVDISFAKMLAQIENVKDTWVWRHLLAQLFPWILLVINTDAVIAQQMVHPSQYPHNISLYIIIIWMM